MTRIIPLVLTLAVLTACGDPDAVEEEATPQEPSSVSTAAPATPLVPTVPPAGPEATLTAVSKPPPDRVPLTPQDAAGLLPGCDAGWNSVEYSGVTLCFPDTFEAFGRPAEGLYPPTITLSDTVSGMFIGVSLVDETPVSAGAAASMAAWCDTFTSAHNIPFTLQAFSWNGGTAELCAGTGDAGEAGIDPIEGFHSFPDGEILHYTVIFSHPPDSDLALGILSSATVN